MRFFAMALKPDRLSSRRVASHGPFRHECLTPMRCPTSAAFLKTNGPRKAEMPSCFIPLSLLSVRPWHPPHQDVGFSPTVPPGSVRCSSSSWSLSPSARVSSRILHTISFHSHGLPPTGNRVPFCGRRDFQHPPLLPPSPRPQFIKIRPRQIMTTCLILEKPQGRVRHLKNAGSSFCWLLV